MKKNIKGIGILTSGGDSPGMNPAVRAVARYAISCGINAYGIYEGYKGLCEGEGYIQKFEARDVSNIINKGGTMLYSARFPEFKEEEYINKAVKNCKKFGIDGLVVIGGDGSFRGASDLCKKGIPCIGIPGTIDNDITSTDYSIGFDTAMNTVIEAVDRLRDTCESHERCNVVEVMGRNAGYIALETAIAVGATVVVIKEDLNYNEADAIEKIRASRAAGKRNIIVIVAEGVDGYSEGFAKRIQEQTGIETKFARLAHIVRGGTPSLRDRLEAARFGTAAIDLLLEGKKNIFVCERDGKITYRLISEAMTLDYMYKKTFTPDLKLKKTDAAPETYCERKQKEFNDFVAMRQAEVKDLLKIANEISNYS